MKQRNPSKAVDSISRVMFCLKLFEKNVATALSFEGVFVFMNIKNLVV